MQPKVLKVQKTNELSSMVISIALACNETLYADTPISYKKNASAEDDWCRPCPAFTVTVLSAF